MLVGKGHAGKIASTHRRAKSAVYAGKGVAVGEAVRLWREGYQRKEGRSTIVLAQPQLGVKRRTIEHYRIKREVAKVVSPAITAVKMEAARKARGSYTTGLVGQCGVIMGRRAAAARKRKAPKRNSNGKRKLPPPKEQRRILREIIAA